MSDMTGRSANDLIRNLTRQGLSETLQQADQAKAEAEAERKRKEQEEKEAAEKRELERLSKNSNMPKLFPRFDPELIKRTEYHKMETDRWIEVCKVEGKKRGVSWGKVACDPQMIHRYYHLHKRLIEDILKGNYVAAGYVAENILVFFSTTGMDDTAFFHSCVRTWTMVLLELGEKDEAAHWAEMESGWFEYHQKAIMAAATGDNYEVLNFFAKADPAWGKLNVDEARERYAKLALYPINIMNKEVTLHFVD